MSTTFSAPTSPATPLIDSEKAPPRLSRQLSDTPLSLTSPPSSFARHSRLYLSAISLFLLLGLNVGLHCVGGWNALLGRWGDAAEATKGGVRTLERRQETEAMPTYSTSVYENGDTSTFVYTTRPIVNPQGYTIGTLTGYVHDSSTPTPTSSVVENFEETSASATGPTAFPTFSTSTFDDGHESTYIYTTRPIVNPGGYTIGTLTGYVPQFPSSITSTPSPTTTTSTTSFPTSAPTSTDHSYDADEFSSASKTVAPAALLVASPPPTIEQRFDDSSLLHRRGINFALDGREVV
ncbi:hypothetical protein P7C70_g3679, partial [Phenoliferia sp. Uapishka_3]